MSCYMYFILDCFKDKIFNSKPFQNLQNKLKALTNELLSPESEKGNLVNFQSEYI